jgi:dTDP-4-dehydrorhamnose reductase
MNILVLGASGMIGSAMFRVLSSNIAWHVWGTSRATGCQEFFPQALRDKLMTGVDVERQDAIVRTFARVRPDVVVNCIGLTKHHMEVSNTQLALKLNAMLPHSLADLCAAAGARLIHVSTDCVFVGSKGKYLEDDAPDAVDVYGKTKHLGEVNYPHAITLRTSTIGHELHSSYGLLEWFLTQQGSCKGYSRAIFSGLTNTEFARVVRDLVIPRVGLKGLYHVGAGAIAKHELLQLIAAAYGKEIDIVRDVEFVIDRSLNSQRFCQATGYTPPAWPELIQSMHASYMGYENV